MIAGQPDHASLIVIDEAWPALFVRSMDTTVRGNSIGAGWGGGLSMSMFATVAIVSQLSASEDVLNWQLRMSVAKAWTMVGSFIICCNKSHVLQLHLP
eukprot:2070250-Ditylum_brightwellii.AAC.1